MKIEKLKPGLFKLIEEKKWESLVFSLASFPHMAGARDKEGKTVLILACENGIDPIYLKKILKLSTKEVLEATDENGFSAIYYLLFPKNKEVNPVSIYHFLRKMNSQICTWQVWANLLIGTAPHAKEVVTAMRKISEVRKREKAMRKTPGTNREEKKTKSCWKRER